MRMRLLIVPWLWDGRGAENVHLLSMLYSNMAFTKTNKPKQLKSILLTVTLQGDKAYQLLAHGRWFSPVLWVIPPLKLVAGILLKVAFSTKESYQIKIMEMESWLFCFSGRCPFVVYTVFKYDYCVINVLYQNIQSLWTCCPIA